MTSRLGTIFLCLWTVVAHAQHGRQASPAAPAQPENGAFSTERGGFLLAAPYRLDLLMMRDYPDLITTYSPQLARSILTAESLARRDLDATLKQPPFDPAANKEHPAFVFEWSSMIKADPSLASTGALDVYLRPDADWPFLKRAPGWSEATPKAWVGMFLFPPAGDLRHPSMSELQDASAILSRQLALAAKRESADLWFPIFLSAEDYVYDPAAHVLRFKTELLPSAKLETAQPEVRARAGYKPPVVFPESFAEPQRLVGQYRALFPELTSWREMREFDAKADSFGLDRQLHPPPVPLNAQVADDNNLSAGGHILHLRLFLKSVQARTRPAPNDFLMTAQVAKIEVVSDTGSVLATIPAASLPLPGAVATVEPSPLPGLAQELRRQKSAAIQQTVHARLDEQGERGAVRKENIRLAREKKTACSMEATERARREVPVTVDAAGHITPDVAWHQTFQQAQQNDFDECMKNGPQPRPGPRPATPVKTSTPPANMANHAAPPAEDRGVGQRSAPEAMHFAIPKSYALLFASDDYTSWPKLSNPVNDAQTIATRLRTSYSFTNVEVVTNATRDQIYRKLEEYGKRSYDPSDQLFIFFAGHGQYDPERQTGYLVPRDAKLPKDDPYHHDLLSYPDLKDFLHSIPVQHLLLVLDACFSGSIDRAIIASSSRGDDIYAGANLQEIIERESPIATRMYITSGSMEYVPDGEPGHHSPFVAALLETLGETTQHQPYATLPDLEKGLKPVKPMPRYGQLEGNEPSSDFFFLTNTAQRELAGH